MRKFEICEKCRYFKLNEYNDRLSYRCYAQFKFKTVSAMLQHLMSDEKYVADVTYYSKRSYVKRNLPSACPFQLEHLILNQK